MNFKDFQKEIHDYAKGKGWWDSPRTLGALIALCHSELSEALVAYRGNDIGPGITQVIYVEGKPEGVAVELADTVIRILDMAEYYQKDLSIWLEVSIEETINKAETYAAVYGLASENLTLPDYIAEAHRALSKAYWPGSALDGLYLSCCIAVIAVMSKRYDIPLEEAIRVKMEYNRTRPYRHGGKAI